MFVTYFNAYNPRNAVENRKQPIKIVSLERMDNRLGTCSTGYMPIPQVLAKYPRTMVADIWTQPMIYINLKNL